MILQPYPAITFTTIGGILDFFIYIGPTPSDVIRQHMLTIGLPFMPPYFSLGYVIDIKPSVFILFIFHKSFHLCRWGYENQENFKAVIERNRLAKMPYVN